jgi:hypothetical protein
MRQTGPSVTVIIVNYRTADLTCLAAGSALDAGAAEVIVVDNASGDGSADRIAAMGDRVSLIASRINDGFGTAVNAGAARATSDILLLLNSDATLRPGAMGTLVREVDGADGRCIAGPRLVGQDGEIQRSAGLVPRPDDLILRGLEAQRLVRAAGHLPGFRSLIGRSRIAGEYDLAVSADRPIGVSMVSGACMAVGREAFAALGGFDERYFMYFEDADLCRRASQAGMPIRYVPDAVVDHVGGASSAGDYRFGPWHAASMIRYLRTWHGRAGVLAGLGVLWVRAVGSVLLLRPARGRAVDALRAGIGVAASAEGAAR